MQIALVALGLLLWSALCVGIYFLNKRRARGAIRKWAVHNNLKIMDLRFRFLRRGPFLLAVRDGDQIYEITVQRDDNEIVTGWLRCNVAWTGRLAGRVDVRWDQVRGFPVIMQAPPKIE